VQLPQADLLGRVQPVQAYLPLGRVSAIVRLPQALLIITDNRSGFLESLCDYLYDHLRPRILHEPSLETLCGVCTVLQALMVQDVSLDGGEDDDTVVLSPLSSPSISPFGRDADDYFGQKRASVMQRQNSIGSRQYSGSIMTRRDSATPHRRRRKPLSRLHTEVLLKMVLQDAQTRLVFRAQALIQADVQYYAPKEGDLEYPEKLGIGGSRPSFQVLRLIIRYGRESLGCEINKHRRRWG
jgi:hypothetical protein